MKIKVEATIEINSAWGDLTDKDEREWFDSVLNDKEGTMLILWSNDIGDEIGQTREFKHELIKDEPVPCSHCGKLSCNGSC